ncbi:hypothetical protein Fmac_022980 [Flemingia macrophylla]|uniref:RING-type domain-containing protein n=1 Tax=Flemingia macrophylla TaxID=520843 RepID=A0ABD1LK72_9FABA
MNCFMVCQSRLWVVSIVLYTCILIPLMELKRALGRVVLFSCETKLVAREMDLVETPSLPVTRYEDLRFECEDHDEICSICLVEYEGEDAVTKLARCGHVFHLSCIHQWIQHNQFSCPLCRSFFFSQHPHN